MGFFFPSLVAELGHRERSPVTQPSEPPPASLATLGRAPRLGTVGTEHSYWECPKVVVGGLRL